MIGRFVEWYLRLDMRDDVRAVALSIWLAAPAALCCAWLDWRESRAAPPPRR